jgi:cathepsin L
MDIVRFTFAALLVAGCFAEPPSWQDLDSEYTFAEYVRDYQKAYATKEEYESRRELFRTNLNLILQHNLQRSTEHAMGINQFTDQHPHELPLGYNKSGRHGWGKQNIEEQSPSRSNHRKELPFEIDPVESLPDSIDWRDKGIVSPVKDQGGCGSCWAFASTAVLESHIALQTGTLFSLSPQELVSCVDNPLDCGGDGGCTGATAELAYDFVAVDGHGMVQEYQFGYQSYYGDKVNCTIMDTTSYSTTTSTTSAGIAYTRSLRGMGPDPPGIKGAVATIEGYSVLPSNDYAALMNAVAKNGPIVVSVAASGWGTYAGGIYSNDSKESDAYDLNHAVVLVGYGTDEESGEDFWLIRNSWRPTWGEGGYIRLKRVNPRTPDDPESDCGMDVTPSDGDACTEDENGNPIVPPAVKVCGTSGILFDSVMPIGGKLL